METEKRKYPKADEINEVYKRFNFGAVSKTEKLVELYMSDETKSIANSFGEFFESLVKDSYVGFTHDFFAYCLDKNEIRVTLLFEPSKIIKGTKARMFALFVILYQFGPLIMIPIIAYFTSNWWLLFGIIVCFVMHLQMAKFILKDVKTQEELQGLNFWCTLLLIICIVLFIFIGFSHFIFWPFCILWAWTFYSLAELLQIKFAIRMLKNDPELYKKVLEKNMILVERK
jgi:hypothetical protein